MTMQANTEIHTLENGDAESHVVWFSVGSASIHLGAFADPTAAMRVADAAMSAHAATMKARQPKPKRRFKLALALFLVAYALGKFTYASLDGAGIFVPHVGGYHVSFLESAQ